jgi:hypothetical protein
MFCYQFGHRLPSFFTVCYMCAICVQPQQMMQVILAATYDRHDL